MGDESCRFILEKAADGEVFAAIHGEPGNDMPLLLSTTTAERGRRRLGDQRAQDLRQPDPGVDVRRLPRHGQLGSRRTRRSCTASCPATRPGIEIVDTWDTLGMRATQSQDTVLDKAFCPDELCPVVCPAGFAGAGPFHVAIFAWALTGFAAVYHGAARRAYDITRRQDADAHVDRADQLDGPPPRGAAPRGQDAHGLRRRRRAARPDGRATGRPASQHEDWPVRLVGTRQVVINAANDVVDRALDLSGGAGAFRANRLEQLFRDIRMGRFHPGNRLLAPELIGKLCLGVDPDSHAALGLRHGRRRQRCR